MSLAKHLIQQSLFKPGGIKKVDKVQQRIGEQKIDLCPINHKNDNATMTHLYLGLLAYWLVNTIRHQLKQSDIKDDRQEIKQKASTQ